MGDLKLEKYLFSIIIYIYTPHVMFYLTLHKYIAKGWQSFAEDVQ